MIRRVLLTGDVHGNTGWMLKHVFPQAKRFRCDLVLQLGDFGIWPDADGQRFLNAVNRAADEADIPLWFVDGNHEAFELLYSLPLDAEGRRPVRPFITHLPRGHRWTWAGRTMLACGGAASIDVDYRIPWISWWPQEVINTAEVELCVAGGPADVLFSHDINLDVEVEGAFNIGDLPLAIGNAIYGNRLALQEVVDAVRPSLQIHGHFHCPKDQRIVRWEDLQPVRVVSLNCDDGAAYHLGGHCAVLDFTVLADDVINAVKVID
jgi:hypothetical protein